MTALSEQVSWGELNLVIRQGEDWVRTFTWKDDGQQPVDLTGYSAHAQIRRKVDNLLLADLVDSGEPDASAEMTGTITLGAENGTIVLRIDKDKTTKVIEGRFEWDLYLTPPDPGNRFCLLAGKVFAYVGVTV